MFKTLVAKNVQFHNNHPHAHAYILLAYGITVIIALPHYAKKIAGADTTP